MAQPKSGETPKWVKIKKLLEKGKTVHEVAERLGVTINYVMRVRKYGNSYANTSLEYRRRQWKLRKLKMKLGMSTAKDSKVARILELIDLGTMSSRQIAEEVGVSRHWVTRVRAIQRPNAVFPTPGKHGKIIRAPGEPPKWKRIDELLQQGLPVHEIAKQVGVDASYVHMIRKKGRPVTSEKSRQAYLEKRRRETAERRNAARD